MTSRYCAMALGEKWYLADCGCRAMDETAAVLVGQMLFVTSSGIRPMPSWSRASCLSLGIAVSNEEQQLALFRRMACSETILQLIWSIVVEPQSLYCTCSARSRKCTRRRDLHVAGVVFQPVIYDNGDSHHCTDIASRSRHLWLPATILRPYHSASSTQQRSVEARADSVDLTELDPSYRHFLKPLPTRICYGPPCRALRVRRCIVKLLDWLVSIFRTALDSAQAGFHATDKRNIVVQ